MSAPLCPVHNRSLRPGKEGSKWEGTWYCSEFVGQGEPGANDAGYCNQRVGSPRQGGGRPAQRPAARPNGPGASQATSPAVVAPTGNLRALAMDYASRVFQGAGANTDTWFALSVLAEQIHGWLTDDGAGER